MKKLIAFVVCAIPATGLAADLFYSGVLTNGDKPANGDQQVRLRLLTATGDQACAPRTETVPITNGRFRAPFSAACAEAVKTQQGLKVELVVGTSAPIVSESITPVPYAVKAERADSAALADQATTAASAGTATTAGFASSASVADQAARATGADRAAGLDWYLSAGVVLGLSGAGSLVDLKDIPQGPALHVIPLPGGLSFTTSVPYDGLPVLTACAPPEVSKPSCTNGGTAGVAFQLPRPAAVQVCVDFGHEQVFEGSNSSFDHVFHLAETADGTESVLQLGRPRRITTGSNHGAGSAISVYQTPTFCDVFRFATVTPGTPKVIRLLVRTGFQNVAGSFSRLNTGINFTVTPLFPL